MSAFAQSLPAEPETHLDTPSYWRRLPDCSSPPMEIVPVMPRMNVSRERWQELRRMFRDKRRWAIEGPDEQHELEMFCDTFPEVAESMPPCWEFHKLTAVQKHLFFKGIPF